MLGLLGAMPGRAAPPAPLPSPEYQVKAVFLFNFAQFVEWPSRAFAAAQAPLVIGVLGEDPFGPYLDDLVRGERIGERPLRVERYARAADVGACHVLFVSRSEADRLGAIVTALGHQPVLTISDADTFIRSGGMVRLVTDGGKIRLRINLDAAKASDLTISSKIMRLATIVTAERN